MAMVKANAYGHGLVEVARALSGADSLAVARPEEAEALRAAGVDADIVLLEGVFDAALAATRESAAALRRRSRARRVAIGLAYRCGWARPVQLAPHLGVHPNTVSRIASKGRRDEVEVAARCLDPRLRARLGARR